MQRAPLNHGTCWDNICHPVALPRDPRPYDAIAEILDELAPPDWLKATASVVIDGKGRRTCQVGTRCGATTQPDEACVDAMHDAIMELGARCLMPKRLVWIGIWIEHDFREGIMIVRMMHGGPRPSAAPPLFAVPEVATQGPVA